VIGDDGQNRQTPEAVQTCKVLTAQSLPPQAADVSQVRGAEYFAAAQSLDWNLG
jgi:hypothetical protein